MIYTKEHYSFREQLVKLKDRGLKGDDELILDALRRIGYYRLSGYTFSFLDNKHFYNDITINQILEIYEFDRRLRNCLFDEIEQIEVYLRTNISYVLSSNFGVFDFLNKEVYPNLTIKRYAEFLHRCIKSYERSNEQFIQHFKEKYGDNHEFPPVWMMVNILEMGTLLTMFRGLDNRFKRELSVPFNVHHRVMESWLMSVHVIRNICAHHGRLWNRRIGVTPKIPKRMLATNGIKEKINDYQLSAHLFVIEEMIKIINPNCPSLNVLCDLKRQNSELLLRFK